MALGGGEFTVQNKILPGTYINFVSLANASAQLSDRGIAAFALEMDWGKENAIIDIDSAMAKDNALVTLGYDFGAPKLAPVRDILQNVQTLYLYRLNGAGVKAANTYATAKYAGTRGNDLYIAFEKNTDGSFDAVTTLMDNKGVVGQEVTREVDRQTISALAELVDSDWVIWIKTATMPTADIAATALAGGTNSAVTPADHAAFIEVVQAYSFNAVGSDTQDDAIKQLYVNFVKDMRDSKGVKFQCVLYRKTADYEGVVNVINGKAPADEKEAAKLVYWVTGVIAGCPVNKSNLNRIYTGEALVYADLTQAELEQAIKSGQFALHRVGQNFRVLNDINSLTTVTADKGDIFKENQTIRVIDQIANDIAVLFHEKYLGVIPNDASGRVSLWADIVKHHEYLQSIRAIEDFSDDDIAVTTGATKQSVLVSDTITIVNAMAKLYMTVQIQ